MIRRAFYRWSCDAVHEVLEGERPLEPRVSGQCPTCKTEEIAHLEIEVDLQGDGLLWLINRVVFMPRGYCLAVRSEQLGDGAFRLAGAGDEAWTFEPGLDDEGFERARVLLENLDQAPWIPEIGQATGLEAGDVSRLTDLEAENRRLREEVTDLRAHLDAWRPTEPGTVLIHRPPGLSGYWISAPSPAEKTEWEATLRRGIPAAVPILALDEVHGLDDLVRFSG